MRRVFIDENQYLKIIKLKTILQKENKSDKPSFDDTVKAVIERGLSQ